MKDRQEFWARLLVEPSTLERFLADPAGTGAEHGLSAEESRELADSCGEAFRGFARALRRKRRGEVRRILPRLTRALGNATFDDWFEAHAAAYVPKGIKRHRDDALAFARFASARLGRDDWRADLARWESARAGPEFDGARCFAALRLRHDVPGWLARGGESGAWAPERRATWVFGIRLRRGGAVHWYTLVAPRLGRSRSRGGSDDRGGRAGR